MKIRQQQRPVFVIWCWLYLALGACCLIAGLFLLLAPLFLHNAGDNGLRLIGAICVIFGLARMGNSLYALGQLRRPRP